MNGQIITLRYARKSERGDGDFEGGEKFEAFLMILDKKKQMKK